MRIEPMRPQQRLIRPWTRSRIVAQHKAAFLLLLLGIQSRGVVGRANSSPDPSALVSRTRPALVVLVSVDRHEKAKSFGTGFFISQDGILVTARHVAQAEGNLVAITQDGRKFPVTLASLEHLDGKQAAELRSQLDKVGTK